MNHNDAIQYWEDMASSNPDEKTVKVNPQNDYTALDAEFIMKYANSNSVILDLASGTGLTVSKYYDQVGHIDAVEAFSEFTKFIPKSPNIDIYNQSIVDFESSKKYDLVLMFGIVQYFNEAEIEGLYRKYKNFLKPKGKLIIKNQFGVNEDVVVSGISKELNRQYHSQYRHLNSEMEMLEIIGFTDVRSFDVYPPEANRWDNTHFYAITAEV